MARFLLHSVYQLSVYLALKGACLPTAFQVENYSLYWAQAPNPHTNQHQPHQTRQSQPSQSSVYSQLIYRAYTCFQLSLPKKHARSFLIGPESTTFLRCGISVSPIRSQTEAVCVNISRVSIPPTAPATEYSLLRRVMGQVLLRPSFSLTVHSHASSVLLISLASIV